MKLRSALTQQEAHRHIIDAVPEGYVRVPACTIDEVDEVVTWSARVQDVRTDAIGWATFDEHYGAVDVVWS